MIKYENLSPLVLVPVRPMLMTPAAGDDERAVAGDVLFQNRVSSVLGVPIGTG
jgi:hypothetical protein